MAAGEIAPPGSKYGPCFEILCGHIDCKATRKMAAQFCRYCDQPIGYETRMYSDPLDRDKLVHAVCLEIEAEAEQHAERTRVEVFEKMGDLFLGGGSRAGDAAKRRIWNDTYGERKQE